MKSFFSYVCPSCKKAHFTPRCIAIGSRTASRRRHLRSLLTVAEKKPLSPQEKG